ncbi:hypothetical protein GCM10027317_29260 [Massilia agri]
MDGSAVRAFKQSMIRCTVKSGNMQMQELNDASATHQPLERADGSSGGGVSHLAMEPSTLRTP